MNKNYIIIFLTLILLSSCSSFYRVLNLIPSDKLKEVAFVNKTVNLTYKFQYSDTTKNKYLRKLRINYGLDTISYKFDNEIDKIHKLDK